MVAKGLDFPNVTLVGVLAADLSLYVDNYRAAERTFSLLTQVVGRAGRGGTAGRAVIQTYTPENDVIQCAARQDYQGFYENEIRLRRLRRFPPFADLFTFTVSGAEEGAVLRAAAAVREELRRLAQSAGDGRRLPGGAGARPGAGDEAEQPLPLPLPAGGEERQAHPGGGELAFEVVRGRPRQPWDESICGLQLHGVSSVLKEDKDVWLCGKSWCRGTSA